MTSLPTTRQVGLPTHTATVLEWGPADGPLVLALHGFPDTAWTWRHLGPFLAERGWRVAAPFLRGYAPSGIPSDGVVTVDALADDAVRLHEELGGDDRAVLVGHDWGAIIGSALGARRTSPFGRVAALAVPPIAFMQPRRHLLGTWAGAAVRQPLKSWYIAFNQVPGLAERRFEPLVRRLWRDWSPGYDATDDLALVLESVPDEAHARAVLSYYRQALRSARSVLAEPLVPTLFLQGDRDGCLDRRWAALAAAGLEAADPASRAVVVPAAGHFLQLEQPDVVNAHVAEFLAG